MNIDALRESASLEGKVAIVTGASRPGGQGYAAAEALLDRGASVVVTDIAEAAAGMQMEGFGMGSATQLESAVARLIERGGQAMACTVDVTDKEQIQACVDQVIAAHGGVDILVNNAGVFVGAKPLEQITDADWELSFNVHMKGISDFCRAVVPSMRSRGGGVIINNSSIHGVAAAGGALGYSSTKYGMVGLSKSLADELGPDNIRVNVVCPGNIWTDISQREAELLAQREGAPSADTIIARMEDECALGRYGSAAEIGQVMAFLASPAAAFITGASIRVDGGIKGYLF